ncbi:amino acid transporter [Paenibacillus elgii]|uniref:Amino acid transporter n=1 Tax=Paenibacillus elgii TaxID=189691 RepID=A0A163UL82_9BACL|nr:APC family permease [Paenibacillus elgii]KZE73483.1 amino acid transporter [Paenibacillus elgii]
MIHHSLAIEAVIIAIVIVTMWSSVSNFISIKRIIIGRPMRLKELHAQHNKLFWILALPILSADLYSSVSYGPESGITELAGLGPDARWIILPITVSTVILLAILIVSYIMGVLAYPNGGGAYAIAKDNFKRPLPSLVASASLLVDYILTVAVSVSAAVQAVASAYPAIGPYKTALAVLCVVVLLLVNLRGVAESATIFAWPTFFFMGCMLWLIAAGFLDEFRHGFVQPQTPSFGTVPEGLTLLLVLKAFSSACSALTGIETISNAVPIFRDPKQKSAVKTYLALGAITAVTLLGFAYHLYVKGIAVNPANTMLSQLAQSYFGKGPLYQIIIWSTFIVLILAANSTFTGFPQLSALVASDGFLPRALTNRGDRLGYSNGIILLAGVAIILIEIFHAQTNALIPLYAIGVFLSFTIAQFGLCMRWMKVKGRLWKTKLAINGVGTVVTAIVAMIFAVTKFVDGAWIVLIVLPVIILFSVAVRRHYNQVAEELRIDPSRMKPQAHRVRTIVLVSGVHRVVYHTISFAKSLNTDVTALFVGFDEESIERMKKKWEEWGNPFPLVTLRGEFRSLLSPISQYIGQLEDKEGHPDHIHLILPQFIPRRWWHHILHNQSALLLRSWFFRNKDVVITTVPYHLRK